MLGIKLCPKCGKTMGKLGTSEDFVTNSRGEKVKGIFGYKKIKTTIWNCKKCGETVRA